MAYKKFRKIFGEVNLDIVVLAETVHFDEEGIGEVSDEVADILASIPGYEAIEDEEVNENDGDPNGDNEEVNENDGDPNGDNEDPNEDKQSIVKATPPAKKAPTKKR